MKKITFDQTCRLLGRKGVEIYNEKHQLIDSWVLFFTSEMYYTDEKNLSLLTPKTKEAIAA